MEFQPGPGLRERFPQPHPQGPQQHIGTNLPDGPYRSRSARKKAVLIGVNYPSTSAQLPGSINDARNMQYFLWHNCGIPLDAILMLYDEGNPDAKTLPTRMNIVHAVRWLLEGTAAGDSLFFYFSGHGSKMHDPEEGQDSVDDTICPSDYETEGQIADDQINDILVKPLPQGVKLTAVIDCAHTSTALDLLFEHRALSSHVTPAPGGLHRPDTYPVAANPQELVDEHRTITVVGDWAQKVPKRREMRQGQHRPPSGEVICLSGYRDPNAVDTTPTQGAIAYSLISAVERNKRNGLHFAELLDEMRKAMIGKFDWVPVLSSSRPFDMYTTRFTV